jgi:hypothetical protein
MVMDNKNMPAMACTLKIEVKNSMGSGSKTESYPGLTKLEHFTALAMQSAITVKHGDIAAQSIRIANAVLDELDKIKG